MPYYQANECLNNPDSTLPELVKALEDTVFQYAYIAAMASHGLREASEGDLLKLANLQLALENKIEEVCST